MSQKIFSLLLVLLLVSNAVSASGDMLPPPSIQAPSESTVFFTDPQEVKSITESADTTYLSESETVFSAQQAQNNIANITSGLEKIKKQIIQLDRKYGKEDAKYLETRARAIQIIKSIEMTNNKLDSASKKILFYQKSIATSVDTVNAVRAAIAMTKDNIKTFTQFMYKLQNDYYDENGKIDEIKLFIKSTSDVSNELSNTAMVESVMYKMSSLMNSLTSQEKNAVQTIKNSNRKRLEIKSMVNDYHKQLTTLQEQVKFLSDYLTLYENNKVKMNEELAYLFSTQADVYKDIVASIKKVIDLNFEDISFNFEEKFVELQSTTAFAKRDADAAPLSWPIYPVKTISKYFGNEAFLKQYNIPFQGIEIPAIQNTPLYASDEGLVYKIANKENIGMNWILLIHKSGYMTVYLYPNKVLVQEGDIVRRGQIIGFSGGEPGSEGAGFVSGGPNLTFMVIKDGKFVDPIDYLDMSVLQDQASIPVGHKFKYLKDKYSLPRSLYAVKSVEGESIEERRQNFLNLYGVGVYRQSAFWIDASEGSNIDVDVGICIAFAESTLGKHLTTANNIGNVGNNDRGDRIAYESPLNGARRIYSTLNNQYLGHYNIVLDFNGYGNEDGKKYATSPYNRQNNVTKCLTMIKGYYVPDDYPVRVGPNPQITKQ